MCEFPCVNTIGSFECRCPGGGVLNPDQRTCSDVDECLSNNTNSCQFACINTLGSYKCQCPVGYHLSADGKKCQDVNDCSLTNRPFHQSQCYNTRGSYQCLPSSCPQQYHQVGGGSTAVIDGSEKRKHDDWLNDEL
ncbi:fibulin-1-like [Acropora millepora]|uniref:fibulin-1-like n=1 Tax=Acropora millepora TaxID=45264 RepID=UPI001CF45ABF|nr:fibulin-1-like [Acropora millepora]